MLYPLYTQFVFWSLEVNLNQGKFQAKKLNTHGELELAANQAEPENQAWLVPGPDPDQIKNFKFFFQKIKSATMPIQYVKGQPDPSTYV